MPLDYGLFSGGTIVKNPLPSQLRSGNTVGSVIAWAFGAWLLLAVVVIASWRLYLRGGASWYPALYDLLSWLPVVLVSGFLVFLLYVIRTSRRSTTLNSQGLALLQAGDREGATRIFESVLAKGRGIWTVRVVALWNLAMVQLLDGAFDRAQERWSEIERVRYRTGLRELYEGVPSLVALAHALVGRLDEARLALEEQQRRRTQVHLRSWVLPEAVILCRSGDPAAALARIDEDFRTLETSGSGHLLPAVRIVRAFAAARAGVDRPQLLAVLEPVPRRELGWTRSWPELLAWIEANGKVLP